MKVNFTATKKTALVTVMIMSATLSLAACGSKGGGVSSKEFSEPADAASYWLSAVQSGDFDKACEAMSPGAVSDILVNTGEKNCGVGLKTGLEWYGDMEDYSSLLAHGKPDRTEATQCGELEVGKTCWAYFIWDESADSGKYTIDKLLVRSPKGFQVSMLANEGETGYDNPQAGEEVKQEGGLFPTAHPKE